MIKKVVPLICEGQSDLIALEDYLNDLFINDEIKFVISNGDILGDIDNENEYFDDLIYRTIFKNAYKNIDFELEDILMVAHLIDSDGVFTSDDIYEFDKKIDSSKYFDNKIVVKDVIETRKTRIRRRERINECLSIKSIKLNKKEIPYRIFYMSSNLEHVT